MRLNTFRPAVAIALILFLWCALDCRTTRNAGSVTQAGPVPEAPIKPQYMLIEPKDGAELFAACFDKLGGVIEKSRIKAPPLTNSCTDSEQCDRIMIVSGEKKGNYRVVISCSIYYSVSKDVSGFKIKQAAERIAIAIGEHDKCHTQGKKCS